MVLAVGAEETSLQKQEIKGKSEDLLILVSDKHAGTAHRNLFSYHCEDNGSQMSSQGWFKAATEQCV